MANDGVEDGPRYTLIYHPYSICSLMVMYTLALRGRAEAGTKDIQVDKQVVDILHGEQLAENFLCEVNKYGKVPVLMGRAEGPLPDSLDITYYLATIFPKLLPAEKEQEIRALLAELHSVNFFSLSFPERPYVADGMAGDLKKRLADPSISDRHRKALEFKQEITQHKYVEGIIPQSTAKNEDLARALLTKIEGMVESPNTWLYGSSPTILDAHLVPFLARITEVGRGGLIPPQLKEYAAWATARQEWMSMMEGRGTMVPE